MMEKDGYIFCFDLTQENSLAELQPFYELHQELNEDRNVSIILLGNKKDLVVFILFFKKKKNTPPLSWHYLILPDGKSIFKKDNNRSSQS